MLKRIDNHIINLKCVLFFLHLLIASGFLEASIINPDLAPEFPGYEEFVSGRLCFNEKNWGESIRFFTKAIKKSHKPTIRCSNYLTSDGSGLVCGDFNENVAGYIIRDPVYEIAPAIYRHSHFYLGLIRLHQKKINKASLHFKRAIGFNGCEDKDEMQLQFYKCANAINPSWIALASLSQLHIGNFEEANQLMSLAWWTIENSDYILDWYTWRGIVPEYWQDLKERGITSRKWDIIQCIILSNTDSIIASSQNNLKDAIYFISQAIYSADYALSNGILTEDSKNISFLYINRGVLYYKEENYQAAIADLTKAIDLHPSDAEIYSLRAEIYLMLEEYTNALNDYFQAISLDPHNPEHYRKRALAHAIVGSLDKAEVDLESAEIKRNKQESFCNELGIIEFSKGFFQASIAYFTQFIQCNPHLSVGYKNRASALLQNKQAQEAIHDCEIAIRLDPMDADLYQLKAVILLSLTDLDEEERKSFLEEAQRNLLKAQELNPCDVKAYQTLAASYFIVGNSDKSLEYYEKALSLAPREDHPQLLKSLSYTYFDRGEYEKAILNGKKAVELGCKEAEIYFILGNCFFEMNQFERAIQKYDLAANAGYDDPNLYFNRSQAYFCAHEFDKALNDANKVLNNSPEHAECYKLRGLIFLSLHKNLEAYSDFHIAMKVGSDDLFSADTSFDTYNFRPNVTFGNTALQFNQSINPLNDRFNEESLLYSTLFPDSHSLKKKLTQINLIPFGKGLTIGILEGGLDTFKELGPFLVNLLFHPIQTTRELLTAIEILIIKAQEEGWETVFEAFAPEIKELFSTWDKIEDFQKGKLTGLFIGKNGVAALTAVGATKTISKLKNAVIGIGKTKCSKLLKSVKPEISTLPTSELSPLQTLSEKGWSLPYLGGKVSEYNFFSEHGFARITPDSIANQSILEARAVRKTQEFGLSFTSWGEVEKWSLTRQGKSVAIESRTIPSSVIEVEIVNPGSLGGKIEVAFNGNGDLVTAHHVANATKILIKTENVIHHVMQKHHSWEKVIRLTGNIKEDFSRVLNFIEDHRIVRECNVKSSFKHRTQPVTVTEYGMEVNGHEVRVFMEIYLEKGEAYLKNAYIKTN